MLQAKHIAKTGKMLLSGILAAAFWLCLACFPSAAEASVYFMQNNNHLRISFDIDRLNDYKIENKDKTLKLSFTYPVETRFNEIKEQYPNLFADYTISEDKKSIALKLNQAINISNYREGNTLVLDVSIPEDEPRVQMNGRNLESAKLDYSKDDGISKFSFEFEELPAYELKKDADKTRLIFGKPIKFLTNSLASYPGRATVTFREETPNQYVFTIPEAASQSFEESKRIIVYTGREQNDDAVAEEENSSHSLLKVRSLSFSWNQPTNIAAFKRGKYLWIVFDRHQNLDTKELSENIAPLAKDLYQLPNPQATILRLTPGDDIKVGIRKEGLLWIVDLYTGGKSIPTREVPVFTRYDALNRAYLFAPVTDARNIVSIFDPEIGDIISVIPFNTTNYGITMPYNYPDFDFIKTINGLVLIYKADDISITTGNSGINIRRDNSDLNISHELDDLKRRSLTYGDDNIDKQFVMNIPAEILNKPFNEAVEVLEQDLIKADTDSINKLRLREAGYFLNKGLGSNALKILNAMEKEKAPESESDIFHGMKGLANFLARRYQEALTEFSYGNLDKNEEAQFWKKLTATALSPKAEDNQELLSYTYMLKNYPDEIRRRIALVAIEPAFMVNDDLNIQNYIDIIRDSNSPLDQEPAINYYNARKLELMGYPLNAIREYRYAANSSSAYFSSLARRRIVNIQRRTNTISLDKAAAEYEKLRYAWGDREFKIGLLEELAEIYTQNKEYYKALETLEEAREHTTTEEKNRLTKKMVSLFEDIYYNNQDDNIPALKSLALYQDYSWLAPMSEHYNAIVQKLADRLVAVDLLGRAYNILETQLSAGNLTPNEAGTVGTRMALINLFNNQPEKAVAILDKTESDRLTPTIIAHRRIIRAKALSALGRPQEALDLLKEDYSRNGILVKTEIFWNNRQWGDAADSIKYLIEKPQKGRPLTNEQIQLILEWATALKKAGRETVIVRLRNTFKPYFQNTPYISIFNVLTDTLEADKIDIKNIDETINNISAFSNFAKIYAESMQKSSLSETIK